MLGRPGEASAPGRAGEAGAAGPSAALGFWCQKPEEARRSAQRLN